MINENENNQAKPRPKNRYFCLCVSPMHYFPFYYGIVTKCQKYYFFIYRNSRKNSRFFYWFCIAFSIRFSRHTIVDFTNEFLENIKASHIIILKSILFKNHSTLRLINHINFVCTTMDEAETAPAKRATLLLAAEDTANVLTHAITIPYAFLAILDLQLHTNTPREFIVLSLYGWVMLSLFSVSAIYHFTSLLADLYPDGRWYSCSRNFLRIVDRSLIHCFIAACYTPWLLLRENGPFAEYVCQAVWFFALFSIIAQNSPFTFAMADTETCVIGSYLLLGVLPATFICAYATDISSLIPLAQGGALYIIGLTFYFAEGYFPFSHAIWHMFVNSGAYLHYSALNEFLIRERMLAQQQQQMLDSTWYSWIASTWHAHVY